MEQLYSGTGTPKADVFSDPSHRMSQRPGAIKSGEGLGFQDMGSSFAPLKPITTYGKSSKNKFKPETDFQRPTGMALRISEDESDDELLLSSQNSMGDASPVARRAVNNKKHETVRVGGRNIPAHPDFKPSSYDAVKGLRFKKTKTTTGESVAELPPPSSLLSGSQEPSEPTSTDIVILDGSLSNRSSSSPQKPSKRNDSESQGFTSRSPRIKVSPTTPTVRETQRAPTKPRPKPRVVITSRVPKGDNGSEATPRPPAPKSGFPLRSKSPEQSTNVIYDRPIKKPPFPCPSPLRRESQEFPMSLKAKENVSDGASSGDVSSAKTKKEVSSRSAAHPKPIPLPSPLKIKPVSRVSTFPSLSPLSSSNEKGKARPNDHTIDLTNDPGKRSGPKPFPLSPKLLAGMQRRSKSPSIRSFKSVKRSSSDDSSTEHGRTTKKRKDLLLVTSNTFKYLHEPIEEDSIDMGYTRDPSKLCPYCDEELPSYPTPLLQQLLVIARKKSISDPRPKNRRGLRAPLTIYISVCQRHRFESHQLPIAAKRGWPKTIDFNKVPTRVKKMKKQLEAIILNKDDTSDIEDIIGDDGPKGPRSRSVFWREVKKEVKKQGIRTVVGVKGQFASFEKAQPGYYGEQGSVIIHQTLFDLFPPSTFDASLIAPLAPSEFIQRILVPEAAARLIAEDLSVDMENAVNTLRDSAQYGVAMFPDTSEHKRKGSGADDDDDDMGVADRIVMERARARRKELAEEERVEEQMLKEERAAYRARTRQAQREKALERARQAKEANACASGRMNTEDTTEVSDASATYGTRRLAEGIGMSTDADSESDAMSVDGQTSKRRSRVTGKLTRRSRDKATGANSQVDGLEACTKRKPNQTREKSTDSDIRIGMKPVVPPELKPVSFTRFTSLAIDEAESTPRPARARMTATRTSDAAGPSEGHLRPLDIVRNRPGPSTSIPKPHDVRSRSPRTAEPYVSDSEPDLSDNSDRLHRVRIRKDRARKSSWLFSGSSSASSSRSHSP